MKHNLSKTKIYKVYKEIKQRCFNPNSCSYSNYGKRGITMCEEWKNDFLTFYKWSIENGYKEEILKNGKNKWTIERKNVNGNYEPNNCIWIEFYKQNQNTTRNTFIEINGETKILSEWEKISKISHYAFYKRYKEGIRGEDLIKPTRSSYRGKIIQKDLNGNVLKIWNSLKEIELEFGKKGTLISNVCKKKNKNKTAYGFIWEYLEK